jgi:predicted transposase/invertase (TIGR01784 family)
MNILDHHYIPLNKYHSTFHLYEDEHREYRLTDILELHFIECPKFRELEFNITDPLHRWLRFLEQKVTPEQMEELMKVDKTIQAAESRLAYLASDEETRIRYAAREKWLHDQASLLYDAEQRGIEKGLEKKEEETVINMLRAGCDVSFIMQMTGISAERLGALRGALSE